MLSATRRKKRRASIQLSAKVISWVVGSIVALAIIVWLAFQVSLYPSAWVIRAMFDQPVVITNQGERARTNMHYAATLGGMALSNAFLGINHSLAHKTGGEFGLPHGLVITIAMQHVIRFNGASGKVKRNPYPRYEVYRA